jgi:RimJ/RimL family protein N-acetyltransferase
MWEPDARAVLEWRYEPPYDLYNIDSPEPDEVVRFLADPTNRYYAITDVAGGLVGFCCFGEDARVPGGDYALDALDIGLGIRPDLTGRRLGRAFVEAVVDFARAQFGPQMLRVTIAAFNERARRVWGRAGFEQVGSFARPADGQVFVALVSVDTG